MKVKTLLQTILIPLMFVCWNIQVGFAQTTVFDYQGRLADERGHPVNGAFQFRFRLFDAAEGGTEIGSMEMRIVVTAGLYNARLDFGEGAFPGTDRFMEVSFQKNPFQPYFTLTPRDQVVSAPYSIKSKSSETAANSNQLSGVPADQFVQINHPALSDDRNPVPGSMNYIQNTVVQQSGANFNVGGSGTLGGTLSAQEVNAATQFKIGGQSILRAPGTDNTYIGRGAGGSISPFGSESNTMLGSNADVNAAFLSYATAIGSGSRVSSSDSIVIGKRAGNYNGVNRPADMVFVPGGFSAGSISGDVINAGTQFNIAGQRVFGVAGTGNTFVGISAGSSVGPSFSSSNNTMLGSNTDVNDSNISYATAIGSGARVSTSDSIVIGKRAGTYNGSSRPADMVFIPGNLSAANLSTGTVKTHVLGSEGNTNLCRNTDNEIANCSSSLRYKTNTQPFSFGLDLVNRLKPITFVWKNGGMHDLGLGAEDVAAIEPLLVTYNKDGQVEGVKYDRIGVVLLNAVKEQQAQIELQNTRAERQQKQIQQQQLLIDGLRHLVCQTNTQAQVCKEVKP